MADRDRLIELESKLTLTDRNLLFFMFERNDRDIRELRDKTDKLMVDIAKIQGAKEAEDKEHHKKQSTTRNKILRNRNLIAILALAVATASFLYSAFVSTP